MQTYLWKLNLCMCADWYAWATEKWRSSKWCSTVLYIIFLALWFLI